MEPDNQAKIPHYARRAFSRLDGGKVLCRQSSDLADSIKDGDGYIYFTMPDGKIFPPKSARFLIEKGKVEPISDGLFEGSSQSFRAVKD